jgi:hypothetical protein
MVQNVIFLPSTGASGGILMAASERFFRVGNPHLTDNTVSGTLTMLSENKEWSITGVYGPQSDNEKNIVNARNNKPETNYAPCMAIAGRF